jgi:hypothetical protein
VSTIAWHRDYISLQLMMLTFVPFSARRINRG